MFVCLYMFWPSPGNSSYLVEPRRRYIFMLNLAPFTKTGLWLCLKVHSPLGCFLSLSKYIAWQILGGTGLSCLLVCTNRNEFNIKSQISLGNSSFCLQLKSIYKFNLRNVWFQKINPSKNSGGISTFSFCCCIRLFYNLNP